ncbi:MAG: hypothetical protein IPG39_13915 [Bacteroidetes bacterium]|nr:hypothetical protein [Bacteroidota bacterium]
MQNYLYAGALLAAVPVIYINNTNVMDYTWALSLTLFSLYAITHKNMCWQERCLVWPVDFESLLEPWPFHLH